jgi:hypothetical protein
MLTKSIKGIVRDGKIEPSEVLDAPDGTEVIVHVPLPIPPGEATMMTFGMFAKPGAPMSTMEDFQEVKKMWEPKELP